MIQSEILLLVVAFWVIFRLETIERRLKNLEEREGIHEGSTGYAELRNLIPIGNRRVELNTPKKGSRIE